VRVTPSKRTDYALKAMIYLASSDSRRTAAPEIAEKMDLSVNYLRQVLAMLAKARLVLSSPSPTGGYALARPATEISVLSIIEATEGQFDPPNCMLRDGPCHWDDVCPMHTIWSGAMRTLAQQLADGSLAEVAANERALASGKYPVPQDAHRKRLRGEGA
jgi:Rrf2 family protein